jgi:hypothetical protein
MRGCVTSIIKNFRRFSILLSVVGGGEVALPHRQELHLPLDGACACALRLSSRVEREAQAASWCGVTAVKRMRGAPLLHITSIFERSVLVVTQRTPRRPPHSAIPQPIRSQSTLVLTLQCACNETRHPR